MRNSHKRAKLIDAVSSGELEPDEAEAKAAQMDIGPLEPAPDPSDFDPMQEPVWTLPMAVAWIAWRTPEAVRDQWDAYRLEHQFWFERHVGGGWELRQHDRASIEMLALEQDIEGNDGIAHAGQDLRKRLQCGDLEATGIKSGSGERVAVPWSAWVDDDVFTIPYSEIGVRAADMVQLWPALMPADSDEDNTAPPDKGEAMPLLIEYLENADQKYLRTGDENDRFGWRDWVGTTADPGIAALTAVKGARPRWADEAWSQANLSASFRRSNK